MSFSFDWLIDPITSEEFFADYYEKKPLVIKAKDRRKFMPVLSIDRVDQFLTSGVPCHPDIFLVDATRELTPDQYSFEGTQPAGRLDLPRFFELFRTGASISISHLHEQIPELQAVCRGAEAALSSHFQTNIYLTPPNAQGFKIHFDSHDVFVLQCEGTKLWSVYDTGIELPLHGMKFDPEKHKNGALTQEFTLEAGDVFYCPRGLYHAARSTDQSSLHVTLGMIGTTWADVVMEAVAKICTEDVAFRANLPPGYVKGGQDRRAAEKKFRALMETLAKKAEVGPLLDRFAADFYASRRVDLRGELTEIATPSEIASGDTFKSRPHIAFVLKEADDKVEIVYGSTKISLPAATRGAIERALSGSPFAVRDLPPPLDEPSKIVLTRRLLREGLIERSAEGIKPAGATNGAKAARRKKIPAPAK